MMDKLSLLDEIIRLSWKASKAILYTYNQPFETTQKTDGSPVTEADIVSHHIICAGLESLTPEIPIISEESEQHQRGIEKLKQFWLVDPLDGTKEFLSKNGEFTTNIALIENQKPTLGVVCAPSLEILYAGIVGKKAFKEDVSGKRCQLMVTRPLEDGLIVLGSRSHGNQSDMECFVKQQKVKEIIGVGSSLKFCYIAEGKAHLYPRLGRTMEWDTAAGQAVLTAAGGSVTTLDNEVMLYGKSGLDNPHFVAKSAE